MPLRWLCLYDPELLDLLFNLTRDVRSLIMPNCSIKWLRLAGSAIPHYIAAAELTYFRPKSLLTFSFLIFAGFEPATSQPQTKRSAFELKNHSAVDVQ